MTPYHFQVQRNIVIACVAIHNYIQKLSITDTFLEQGENEYGDNLGMLVRPEKFQFMEKWQNRNFGYKIVISVKNPKFIIWILDDETNFTVGIVS